jgi:hypothetical protein
MKSTTLVFILLIAAASAFTIVNNDTPNDVNWPYALCGKFEGWEVQNLTLTAAPARNMNDTVDLVNIILFSLLLPLTTFNLIKLMFL